ncbi:MAG TPA: hypothetical protein VHM70_26135 [Polyangiaceae bacterium]|jgi:hypothetical protein|nr:hypothetical protein [Polyangiaceae bacterium]
MTRLAKTLAVTSLVTLCAACGGGAGGNGEPATADGPLPSGSGTARGLVLVTENPEAQKNDSQQGDGTSTPEIVDSVERDKP